MFCCWRILKQMLGIISFASKYFSMQLKKKNPNIFLHNHNAIITSNKIKNIPKYSITKPYSNFLYCMNFCLVISV